MLECNANLYKESDLDCVTFKVSQPKSNMIFKKKKTPG